MKRYLVRVRWISIVTLLRWVLAKNAVYVFCVDTVIVRAMCVEREVL